MPGSDIPGRLDRHYHAGGVEIIVRILGLLSASERRENDVGDGGAWCVEVGRSHDRAHWPASTEVDSCDGRPAGGDIGGGRSGPRVRPATMDIDKDRLVLSIDDSAAQYPLRIDPVITDEQAKLEAIDAAAEDNFGFAVALDGDTAVIGAWLDNTDAGTDAGSAYVFTRAGTVWSQQAKLLATDGAPDDVFGYSVAVKGDTAIIGSPGDSTSAGNTAGSAYVFTRSGAAWTQRTKLEADDAAADDGLGFAVALDGDTAVVSASTDDTMVAPMPVRPMYSPASAPAGPSRPSC